MAAPATQGGPSLPVFPARLFAAVILIDVLVLAFFIRANSLDRKFANEELPRLRRLTELRGTIVHLDEALTMSARMGAATGDPAWEQRYHGLEPKLGDAIREARSLSASLNSADIAATDEANAKLVQMEIRAFSLVREGRREEATAVLFGEEYERQKSIYASGTNALEAQLESEADRAMERAGGRLLAETISIVLLLPLLMAAWYFTMRRVGEWRRGMIALAASVSEGNEMLRQSQKMQAVGRLAGGIAHDFNNLLTVVLGYTQLVQKRLGADHPSQEELKAIALAGERATGLIRQLLTFSRRQVVQPRRLDLNAVVAEMEKMLRPLIGEDVRFCARLKPGSWTIHADPGQVQQVVMNLALNARDAMPNGGSLTVETQERSIDAATAARLGLDPGDYVQVSVTDTGTGMTPEVRARLFEPFFTTKEVGKGTGLGLSTVYGIVKQAGGQVAVESEPGKGSCFRVIFPRSPESEGIVAAAPPLFAAPGSGKSILVVEDDAAVRDLVSGPVRTAGYRVTEAHNGVEALELARKAEFDLVITDVVMPAMGGVELARRLTDMNPRIRVLFISGYPDGDSPRQEGLPADIPFLQKPFLAAELIRKVRERLEDSAQPP